VELKEQYMPSQNPSVFEGSPNITRDRGDLGVKIRHFESLMDKIVKDKNEPPSAPHDVIQEAAGAGTQSILKKQLRSK